MDIKYLDMNKLYRKAMSEYLPYQSFKWVKVNNEEISSMLNKRDNSLHDYILEVDLESSENLHEKHKDFSMAPEKLKVSEKMV